MKKTLVLAAMFVVMIITIGCKNEIKFNTFGILEYEEGVCQLRETGYSAFVNSETKVIINGKEQPAKELKKFNGKKVYAKGIIYSSTSNPGFKFKILEISYKPFADTLATNRANR